MEHAIETFREGKPILIYDRDDREGEVDMVYPANSVDEEAVKRLRGDAGGLICVALNHYVCEELELPFIQEEIEHPATEGHQLSYDERSSFSLTVNHSDTDTGITDGDRARTIREIGKLVEGIETGESGVEEFSSSFRVPGHVHLLRGAPGLLDDRSGHTELGLAVADAAGCPAAVVVCEMLGDDGEALPPSEAQAYADGHGMPYVEGEALERYLS